MFNYVIAIKIFTIGYVQMYCLNFSLKINAGRFTAGKYLCDIQEIAY